MERKSDHATANPIYDEFDPIFNWKTEQGFETLTIYLPGFRKEQLKVQVTTTRKVRVMGERPAGANKWIRFRKEFPIQANIDVDSIGAKFEGANLVVKLPRLSMGKQTSPIGTTAKPPPVPKAQLSKPSREEETKRAEKEKALKATEKENVCDGVKQDYRSKVKNNQRAITLGMVAPVAAVLLLSLGFYAGQMFTS